MSTEVTPLDDYMLRSTENAATEAVGGDEDGAPQGWGVGGIENSLPVRITYTLIAILGIAGNFLVIFTLIRVPRLRGSTSYFIIHLAATDLVTSVWVIPFHMLSVTPFVPGGLGGELVCRLFVSKYPLWVTIFASVYSMLCVTMERFVAVVYPLKYKGLFTRRRIGAMMTSCWLIGILSNWFFMFNYDYAGGHTCAFVPWSSPVVNASIGVYIFSLVYLTPIGTMLTAHWKMIRTLKSQANLLKGRANHSEADKKKIWQVRVAQDLSRMLLVLVLTYAVCWLPNQAIFLAYNLGADVSFGSLSFHLSVILALCNSCINPFIYTLKNRQFKDGVKTALGMRAAVGAEPVASSAVDGRPMEQRHTRTTGMSSIA